MKGPQSAPFLLPHKVQGLVMDDPQQLQEAGLGEVRIKYLGRQGLVTGLMRGLGALPADQRREAGARFNALKDTIAEAAETRAGELNRAALSNRLAAERADATLPAMPMAQGRIHPI